MLKTFDYNKVPIVEVVNEIMVDSAKRGASDIHFDPLENFMKIRIRIDGNLIDYTLVPNDIKKNLITRVKIISGMNITESRLPQDGAIKATLQGTSLDLRVSTIPTNMGEKIVIRILDYSLSGAGIEKLGFSEQNYVKVIDMINQPNGIILVTGATGTGKSTTVYSILQRLNKEEANIVTVEDPVEMNIEGVNQIQTNSEIGLDFATALRSILRQDPNIIMIGEIRDTETAKIAIRASITGHLVLSTLHTNDSLNTIERLLDMDVERYLLASSLVGIISQRLARRLCPHCRKEVEPNSFEQKLYEAVLGHKIDKLYIPVGCDKCHNGYKGRIAIHEVLQINQQIRDAISTNCSKEKLRNLVYTKDVDSLLQDGLKKVEEGLTSMEELLKLIELENDESSIARMGLEESLKLAHDVEEDNTLKEIEKEKKEREQENEIKEETPVDKSEEKEELPLDNETLNEHNKSVDEIKEETPVDKPEEKEELPLENETLNEHNKSVDEIKEEEPVKEITPVEENNLRSINEDDLFDFDKLFNDKKEKEEIIEEPINDKISDEPFEEVVEKPIDEKKEKKKKKKEKKSKISEVLKPIEKIDEITNTQDNNELPINDEEINNMFNKNYNSTLNNSFSFINNLDSLEEKDKKKYDFSDAKGEDLIINDYSPKPEDTLDLSKIKFDVDEPTIELKNIDVKPIEDDLQEGSLDYDFSEATDEDIMNLFD